jgi:hypothetical protein
MKIFEVHYQTKSGDGTDIFICVDIEKLTDCVIERHGKTAVIISETEISYQNVRISEITVGDLMKLLWYYTKIA